MGRRYGAGKSKENLQNPIKLCLMKSPKGRRKSKASHGLALHLQMRSHVTCGVTVSNRGKSKTSIHYNLK